MEATQTAVAALQLDDVPAQHHPMVLFNAGDYAGVKAALLAYPKSQHAEYLMAQTALKLGDVDFLIDALVMFGDAAAQAEIPSLTNNPHKLREAAAALYAKDMRRNDKNVRCIVYACYTRAGFILLEAGDTELAADSYRWARVNGWHSDVNPDACFYRIIMREHLCTLLAGEPSTVEHGTPYGHRLLATAYEKNDAVLYDELRELALKGLDDRHINLLCQRRFPASAHKTAWRS